MAEEIQNDKDVIFKVTITEKGEAVLEADSLISYYLNQERKKREGDERD